MNDLKNQKTKKQNTINIIFDENGKSIIELLESDFADFVSKFIKKNIK